MARQANSAFVVTTPPVTDFEVHLVVIEEPTAHEVLFQGPATEAAERSATEQVQQRIAQAGIPSLRPIAPLSSHRRLQESALTTRGTGIEQ
jgi:hypothetical protein